MFRYAGAARAAGLLAAPAGWFSHDEALFEPGSTPETRLSGLHGIGQTRFAALICGSAGPVATTGKKSSGSSPSQAARDTQPQEQRTSMRHQQAPRASRLPGRDQPDSAR